MINLLYLFLPSILLLGIITSYTDIKYNKIKNKHLLIGLALSITLNIFLIFYADNYNYLYLKKLLFTSSLSLIFGIVLWNFELWTAGDAKLFFVYSTLIPLTSYKNTFFTNFESSIVLINTFVPFALFFFGYLMYKTTIKQKIYYLKKAFDKKIIFNLAVSLFAIFWLINLTFSALNINPNFFVTILYIITVFLIIEKVPFKKYVNIMLIISILRFFFDRSIYSFNFIIYFCIILFGFIFIRYFGIELGFDMLTRNVDINLLKSGMNPAENILFINGKYKKEKKIKYGISASKTKSNKDYIFDPSCTKLSKTQVNKLNKLQKKFKFEHLKVYETIPFAPFIFIGVLLTILFQGDLFIALTFILL
jgi:Flp pilus assembly protein protease CpaA